MNRVLKPFSTTNGLVAWVDVLGVRDMESKRRDALYDALANFLPGFSTNNFKAGGKEIPVNETNSLIVGDAVCITQSSHAAGSRLFVIHAALTLSRILFSAGFSNRGFIVQGSYRADHPENGLPFITGDAIINVFIKEESTKLAGIGIDTVALGSIRKMRDSLGSLYWTKAPITLDGQEYHLLSSNLHFRNWSEFCSKKSDEHTYNAVAKNFIDKTELWDM